MANRSIRLRLAVLASCAAAALLTAGSVQAQTRHHYEISGGDLSAAMAQFSRQSDQEVMFDGALVEGRRTSGFSGDETAAIVLARLLERSGLTFRETADGTLLVLPLSPVTKIAAVRMVMVDAAAEAPEPTPAPRTTEVGEVVVTGSRVITNGNQAPTPITVFQAEKLAQMSPSGIAKALIEMPQFAGSAPERGQNQADRNAAGAYLNLRQFGTQRNLILMDGIRVAPTSAAGGVDINVLPQGLIQRVDIVTGGASAVYGSDAITGVVNFVLDHNFNGVKGSVQYGTSRYGDANSWRASVTAGTPVLDDRGHFEVTYDHSQLDGVADDGHRGDQAGYPNFWTIGGAGTAAAPFVLVHNSRSYSTGAPGGVIKTLGTMRDIVFKENGVPTPFVHGTLVPGSTGLESGGDGAYFDGMNIISPLTTDQGMARFDYKLTNNISAFVQGSYAQFATDYNWQSVSMLNKTILSGNPFIPASLQQFMTDTKVASFNISRVNATVQGYKPFRSNIFSSTKYLVAGLNGDLHGWRWEMSYSYARALEHVINENNLNQEKLAAALDVVRSPTTGQPVCQISLTTSASRFPDCVPLNLFGPTAPTQAAMDFVQRLH